MADEPKSSNNEPPKKVSQAPDPAPSIPVGRGRTTKPDDLPVRRARPIQYSAPPSRDGYSSPPTTNSNSSLEGPGLEALRKSAEASARDYYSSQPPWTDSNRPMATLPKTPKLPDPIPSSQSDHSPPAAGHEALPKNWAEAIPTILFGFYGFAFAFEAVVAMNAKEGTLALLDSAACLICAGVALAWWKRRDWLPTRLRETMMIVATDARWIIGCAMVLLVASAVPIALQQAPISTLQQTKLEPLQLPQTAPKAADFNWNDSLEIERAFLLLPKPCVAKITPTTNENLNSRNLLSAVLRINGACQVIDEQQDQARRPIDVDAPKADKISGLIVRWHSEFAEGRKLSRH